VGSASAVSAAAVSATSAASAEHQPGASEQHQSQQNSDRPFHVSLLAENPMKKCNAVESRVFDPFTPFTPGYIPPFLQAVRLTGGRDRTLHEAEKPGDFCTTDGRNPDARAAQQRPSFLTASDVFEQALGRASPRAREPLDEGGQVAVEKDADAHFRFEKQRARVVDEQGLEGARRSAGVREQALARVVQAIYPGRVVERDEHPLRPVLEVPAPIAVGGVIPADELVDRG